VGVFEHTTTGREMHAQAASSLGPQWLRSPFPAAEEQG
jgi:hypothetical protein